MKMEFFYKNYYKKVELLLFPDRVNKVMKDFDLFISDFIYNGFTWTNT